MNLIIADAAVALVPDEWKSDRSISKYVKKRNRLPIVDGAKHQHLLKDVELSQRKDRPDILHFALLTALGYSDLIPTLSVYFTTSSTWYHVDSDTRLPRAQNRFYGILEQVLAETSNNPFIKQVSPINFSSDDTIYFSSKGRELEKQDLQKSNFVFGGFAHGSYKSFSPSDNTVRLASSSLDVWTAISLFFGKKLSSSV